MSKLVPVAVGGTQASVSPALLAGSPPRPPPLPAMRVSPQGISQTQHKVSKRERVREMNASHPHPEGTALTSPFPAQKLVIESSSDWRGGADTQHEPQELGFMGSRVRSLLTTSTHTPIIVMNRPNDIFILIINTH